METTDWAAISRRARTALADVPDKCEGPTGAGIEPNPCLEPGSLPRCGLCPKSHTYWRNASDV